METVFITGSNGLLGSKVVTSAAGKYHCVALDLQKTSHHKGRSIDYICGDVSDRNRLWQDVKDASPDFIIHAGSFTWVDACETEREKAWQVNVEGTKNVALICRELGIKMIYLSTDYVFDGRFGPYTEDDEPCPLSFYGKTKFEGEKIVAQLLNDFIIARTTVLYGWAPGVRRNFVTWLIDNLKKTKKVPVVTDQFGTPTLADDLAESLLFLYEKNGRGIYNTAGSELIDRFHFALKIAEVFDLDFCMIEKTTSDSFQQPAPRPLNAGLIVDKIYNETGYTFSSVVEGLNKMKRQMQKARVFPYNK